MGARPGAATLAGSNDCTHEGGSDPAERLQQCSTTEAHGEYYYYYYNSRKKTARYDSVASVSFLETLTLTSTDLARLTPLPSSAPPAPLSSSRLFFRNGRNYLIIKYDFYDKMAVVAVVPAAASVTPWDVASEGIGGVEDAAPTEDCNCSRRCMRC